MSVVLLVVATPWRCCAAGTRSGDGANRQLVQHELEAPRSGAGIVDLSAGFGIGRIGSAAVESMSRQPEAAGSIQDGDADLGRFDRRSQPFFGLIVCIIKGARAGNYGAWPCS